MIDTEIEKFTSTGAIDAGLIEAVQRGEAIIQGSYSLSQDGYLEFKQRNFTFTDKAGSLRVGKFVDNYAMMNFCEKFSDLHGIEDDEHPQGVDFISG